MRAVIAKIINGAYVVGTLTPLNRIGSVTESTTTCTSLGINYLAGDYIKNMTITANTYNVVKVVFVTNNGTTLSRGIAGTGTTSKTFLFKYEEPLLAFWGFENNSVNITAIGAISVDKACVLPEE